MHGSASVSIRSALHVAVLVGAVGSLVNGCRVGYELQDKLVSSAGGANGGVTSTAGGTAAAGGSVNAGGASAAGSPGQQTAGCTLESEPGVAYEVGDFAALSGFYVLRGLSSDRCLQPTGCAVLNESAYEQASCSFEACQVFQAVDRGGAWYSLQNVGSGYCLDAGGLLGGNAVVDLTCAPSGHVDEPRQSFQLVCAGEDTWHLVDRVTQGYVAVAGPEAGAALQFHAASGGDEQRFVVQWRPNVFEAVVPTSEAAPGLVWRYVTRRPKGAWEQVAFDDSAWSEGPGGFGDGLAISSPARTHWNDADIWLRRSFTLDSLPAALDMRINHDFNAEVYLNGVEAAVLANWTSGYRQLALDQAAVDSLVVGENVVAVHCSTDPFGEQFIDLGFGRFVW